MLLSEFITELRQLKDEQYDGPVVSQGSDINPPKVTIEYQYKDGQRTGPTYRIG